MSDAFSFQPINRDWAANGAHGMAVFGDDAKLFVVFHDKTVLNAARSEQMGRPEYDVQCYMRLQQPGDNLSITHRPATPADMARFKAQYAMYLDGRGEEQPGTPIDLLFPAHPELVAMFRHLKITTVQALAALDGTGMTGIGMGAQQFKDKAVKYLSMAKEGEAYTHMAAELEKRDTALAARDVQIKELSDRLDRLTKRLEDGPQEIGQTVAVPAQPPTKPKKTGMGTGEI